MSNFKLETCKIETPDEVKLHTRVFKPREENDSKDDPLVVVWVHPSSILGGCQGSERHSYWTPCEIRYIEEEVGEIDGLMLHINVEPMVDENSNHSLLDT